MGAGWGAFRASHSLEKNTWPAAAVIPAPIAYIKVVVVKKLVVEPWAWLAGPPHRVYWSGRAFPSVEPHALHWVWRGNREFSVEKIEGSRGGYGLRNLNWKKEKR